MTKYYRLNRQVNSDTILSTIITTMSENFILYKHCSYVNWNLNIQCVINSERNVCNNHHYVYKGFKSIDL